MNKKVLMLVPMTALFLASCNNKSSTTVNEEEFKNAVTFKDVKYLQESQNEEIIMDIPVSQFSATSASEGTDLIQMSPGVCYQKSVLNDSATGKREEYKEIYSTEKDDVVTYTTKTDEEGDFSEEQQMPLSEATGVYYMTPQDLDIFKMFGEIDIKFEDFEYKDNIYTITKTITSPIVPGYEVATVVNMSLSFLNKKLVNIKVSSNMSEGMMIMNVDATLTYKKSVPADPRK